MAKGANETLDWRAQMRAEDIPRRPPPASEPRSSRPDRGYVEQPEERVNTTTSPPRRREETPTLTTPVALIRFSRDETRPRRPYMDPATGNLVDPNAPESKRDEPEPPSQQQAETAGEPVPKAKIRRKHLAPAVKAALVVRALEGKETHREIARQAGVHPTNISNWVNAAKAGKILLPPSEKTQLSRPSPPVSAVQSAAVSTAAARGARTFEVVSAELQQALDRVRELKRELRGLLDE